jgi:hypothetical protein
MAQTEAITEPGGTRVAVYLNFDNMVISRYDQINERTRFNATRKTAL